MKKSNRSNSSRSFVSRHDWLMAGNISTMLAVVFQLQLLDAQSLPYTYSWIGNTFGDGAASSSGKWVQNNTVDIWVRPTDGSVYTASQWDEAKREAGIYRDGDCIGRLRDLHPNEGGEGARAVTGNSSYVYVANGRFIRRYNFSGSFAPFSGGVNHKNDGGSSYLISETNDTGPYGLATNAAGDLLYCALEGSNQIVVLNTATMTEAQRFTITSPFRIAVTNNNEIWVASRSSGGTSGIVRCYNSSGVLQNRQITRSGGFDPVDLEFDNQGRLLIADNGPDQRILIYNNIDSSPALAGTLGTQGGFRAAPSVGLYGPKRFNGLVGVGTDSAGNIYVGQNMADPSLNNNSTPFGCIIESYNSSQALNWEVKSLAFVDGFAVDRTTSGATGYLKLGRFDLNYNHAGEGRESVFKAFSMDRFAYPLDPRWTYRYNNQAFWPASEIRTIQGEKFVFLNEMWGRMTAIYRLDGEIMVPSGFINTNQVGTSTTNHPGRPSGAWFWRDANGNGAFESGEYSGIPVFSDTASKTAYFDENGNYWIGKFSGPNPAYVYRVNVTGLDSAGNPIYDFSNPDRFGPYSDFNRVIRLDYDTGSDRLILAGYTPDQPSGSLGTFNEKWAGKVIARVNNATGSSPTVVWQTTMLNNSRGPASVRAEGAYVFVAHDGNSGATDSGFVDIYRLSDGVYVGKIVPPSNSNGRVDITHGLEVFHRPGPDVYEIFVEDDWHAKIALFRWNPAGNPPQHSETAITSLLPVADSFVRGGSSANQNYGTSGDLILKHVADTSYQRESYLKFDVSGFNSIGSAKLILTQTALGTENTNIPLTRVFETSNDVWTESGITWNNKVSANTEITNFPASAVGVEYEIDVTSQVIDQHALDGQVTFILKQNNDVNRTVGFGSRENSANQPVLEVSEATTLSLAPVADSYVRGGSSANQNFGTSPDLNLKHTTDLNYQRESYLKFDVSSLDNIASAKLILTQTALGTENTNIPLTRVFETSNDAWTESGITWNNKVSANTEITSFVASAVGVEYEIDVTSQVIDQQALDGQMTFILKQNNDVNRTVSFGSKENSAYQAILEVTLAP